jgi:hypothetical protein
MSFTIPTPVLRALSSATGEDVTTEVVAEWWRASKALPAALARVTALEAEVARLTEPDDHVAAFEREKIIEALHDSGKATPFLVEHVLAGLPLAKLRIYAEQAFALMPASKIEPPFQDRTFQGLESTAARFEDLPPAARVALQQHDPSTYHAMRADWESRDKPDPRSEQLFGRASNGIPITHGVQTNDQR